MPVALKNERRSMWLSILFVLPPAMAVALGDVDMLVFAGGTGTSVDSEDQSGVDSQVIGG